jgi:hypothetical protein
MGWGAGVGAAATAAWAVPTLVAGGGLHWFLAGNRYQSEHAVFAHTIFQDGWGVVPENAHRLASYVPYELPFLGWLLGLALVTLFLWWPARPRGPGAPFLAVWLVPSLLFYVFLYAGWPVFPSGYVLVLVPAVAVAAAWIASALARGLRNSGAPLPALAVAAFLVGLVVALPATWAASWHEATSGQREADAWSEAWWALERDYPANETALVTYYGWFWARVDHPEYLTWGILPYWNETDDVLVHVIEGQGAHDDRPAYADAMDGDPYDPPHPIPPWVKHVVLIHAPWSRGETYVFKPGLAVENLTLESGMPVSVLDPSGLDSIEQAILWYDGQGRLMV